MGSKNNVSNVNNESRNVSNARHENRMELSDRLRTIVSDLNISQTKFANTLGVSFTYINCLLNGKRENISQSLAILIQYIYGYSAQWILFEEGSVLKKIIRRTLKTRTRLIAVLNTLTKEEIDMVIDHIEYVIKETVNNAANELSDVINIKEKSNKYYSNK
jgi:transcriptional regulator with XRE-family HTH domain